MLSIQQNKISNIPKVSCPVDSTSNLAYAVSQPLPKKSFAMYICGQPGSGKSTLWLSMLLSHPTKKQPLIPRYYYRYFDHVYLISCSLDTLPLEKLSLNDERVYNDYDDIYLEDIIRKEKSGENLNNLIVLDDCIRDITRSKIMSKLILNRRHATHNKDEPDQAGLSLMLTSQVYNMLPLGLRKNMSHVVLFRTENQRELDSIRSELMADCSQVEQDAIFKTAWAAPYGFLFIDATKPKKERYYANFSKILI